MRKLPEGSELPLKEISLEARELAESLHHEAKTERIFSIIELALRKERSRFLDQIRAAEGFSISHWKNETPDKDR